VRKVVKIEVVATTEQLGNLYIQQLLQKAVELAGDDILIKTSVR